MVVYLSGGRVSPAALCFDYETDEEELFVNNFLRFLNRNGTGGTGGGDGINIRLLRAEDGLDDSPEGDLFSDADENPMENES